MMDTQPFLQLVAHDLWGKFGNNLSHTAIVFPNKRANLFFNEYLASESTQPVWSPVAISISELFRELSALEAGDPIRLVCELYKIFREETHSSESLDEFYAWGELLISDFDDIDKNLVEADKLFANLNDLKNLGNDYDFLDHEQEEAIQQFFRNFSIEQRTRLKERFISLWDRLGIIYQRYKAHLEDLGIAYEGMLYRDALSHLDAAQLKYERYVFVGFNVLNRVEHTLFRSLQEAGKALFYWDYDIFYTQREGHEAGEFIRRNLKDFPNELPDSYFNSFAKHKTIYYISASTENAQARFLPEWIRSMMPLSHEEKENAVVLCNESLLLPVLHAIPSEVKHVNITMGFPLVQTPIYSLINAVMELQVGGYRTNSGCYVYEQVAEVLRHPYVRRLSPLSESLERDLAQTNRFYPLPSELGRDTFLSKLFTPCLTPKDLCLYLTELIREISVIYRTEHDEEEIYDQLYREALFQSYTKVNRIYDLVESGVLAVRMDTLKGLLGKVLSEAGIPFHGEPAIGLQVMGVLETRNLDFRNLILLSLNEGQLPKAGNDSSFIPYNLRKAFGMTTIEHKNAVYAYYFYRLMQRAEHITLMYNTSSDGLNRGEWSRFMLQLLAESPHTVVREYLEAGQSPQEPQNIRIEKSDGLMAKLRELYDAASEHSVALSPSALNTYLDCPLKFYYNYVARLQSPDEATSEIDSALFGTIFHRAAQLIYTELSAHEKIIQKTDIERLLHDEVRLQRYVDRAFKEKFFKVPLDAKPEYNGLQLINSKVISLYIKQLLRNDLRYAPFEMVGTEQPVREEMLVNTSAGPLRICIGGTIDRMDIKGDTLRIVDYKTGGTPKTPACIEQLFTPAEGRPNYIFQTFLYASIVCRNQSFKVAPALLYIHRASSDDYSPVIEMGAPRTPKIPVSDFSLFAPEFRERLCTLLEEIFDERIPFVQTECTSHCEYCDFRSLCVR